MGDMKWPSHASFCALCVLMPVAGVHAQALGVKTVYLLPMSGGLDQYLALQLTSKGVLQVVTDPKKADAIFTDSIGARLEGSLSDLYRADEKAAAAKSDKDKSNADEFSHPPMRPLSGSRGVVFLVNRATRDVLWSTYERSKGNQPEDLKHAAEKIVERLAKANKTP